MTYITYITYIHIYIVQYIYIIHYIYDDFSRGQFAIHFLNRCTLTQEAYETHRGHLPSSMMAVPYGTELQETG
jgi:hypothetical protein